MTESVGSRPELVLCRGVQVRRVRRLLGQLDVVLGPGLVAQDGRQGVFEHDRLVLGNEHAPGFLPTELKKKVCIIGS